MGWVQIFALVLGSVGLAQSADGLGWIESHKMDPWTTLCWVYATVEESVRPSHQSTATTVASGFAERPASRRYRSTAAVAAGESGQCQSDQSKTTTAIFRFYRVLIYCDNNGRRFLSKLGRVPFLLNFSSTFPHSHSVPGLPSFCAKFS